MITLGDLPLLRAELLKAKKERNFGHGDPARRLLIQEERTIAALDDAIKISTQHEELWHRLRETLYLRPYYAADPSQGSAPIARQWSVFHPRRFHRIIEEIHAALPELSEFPKK